MDSIQISPAVTPNPNTIKFAVNRLFFKTGTCNFPDRQNTGQSQMASKLFEHEAVAGVLIGPDFVAVTKSPEADWQRVLPAIHQMLRDFLLSGAPVVDETLLPPDTHNGPTDPFEDIRTRIVALIEKKIRPVLVEDGGDVEFRGYENGVVQLHLQGACRSCPNATKTLKAGIENFLKRMIPEIQEVISV